MLRGCHEIKIVNFDYPIFARKKRQVGEIKGGREKKKQRGEIKGGMTEISELSRF